MLAAFWVAPEDILWLAVLELSLESCNMFESAFSSVMKRSLCLQVYYSSKLNPCVCLKS